MVSVAFMALQADPRRRRHLRENTDRMHVAASFHQAACRLPCPVIAGLGQAGEQTIMGRSGGQGKS